MSGQQGKGLLFVYSSNTGHCFCIEMGVYEYVLN